MKKERFDIGIDHPTLLMAKAAFNTCMQAAIARAIGTGSNEGSVTLKISFEIFSALDQDTGELKRTPVLKYKAGYSVPMKESMDATIAESSRIVPGGDGYLLVNGQVSMDELLAEDEPEAYRGEKQLAEVR